MDVVPLFTTLLGALIALSGVWLSSRFQSKRDSVAYQRKLQDEGRERLRLIYLDLLDALQEVNHFMPEMLTLAYGWMWRKERQKLQAKLDLLNSRLANIRRQRLLIGFDIVFLTQTLS